MKHRKLTKDGLTTVLYPVLFGILIVILWQTQLLHQILGADSFTLPLPGRILKIISDNVSDVLVNVKATVIVALGGLILGTKLGFLLGIVAAFFPNGGKGGTDHRLGVHRVTHYRHAPIMRT